jgi:uncharacterized membrane-anchored protein YhcB (DUF1043 family)
MGVRQLKRWQWILIGLLVGLALGYVQSSLGPEGFTFGGNIVRWGRRRLSGR